MQINAVTEKGKILRSVFLINVKVEHKMKYKNGYKFSLEILLEHHAR